MSTATMLELRQDFWLAAFRNGKHCGVMRDGQYHKSTDRDWLVMFCGGAA